MASQPAAPPPTKTGSQVRQQTDEELTRYTAAREKSAEVLAKREAEILARFETERRQVLYCESYTLLGKYCRLLYSTLLVTH